MRNQETYPNYRALSSIARILLPQAEKMHRQGMTWTQIAHELRISKSSLHIWRSLVRVRENHKTGLNDETLKGARG